MSKTCYVAALSALLILTLLPWSADAADPGGGPPTGTRPTVAAGLIFHLAPPAEFSGVIDSIDPAGLCRAHMPPRQSSPNQRGVVEGKYLAVVGAIFAAEPPLDAILARAEVIQVLRDNVVEFRVAAPAAAKLKVGQLVYLVRPVGSTTDEMKSIVDWAPITPAPSVILEKLPTVPTPQTRLGLTLSIPSGAPQAPATLYRIKLAGPLINPGTLSNQPR